MTMVLPRIAGRGSSGFLTASHRHYVSRPHGCPHAWCAPRQHPPTTPQGRFLRPRRLVLLRTAHQASSFATPDELHRYLQNDREAESAKVPSHQRLWKAPPISEQDEGSGHAEEADTEPTSSAAADANDVVTTVWKERVADRQSTSLSEIVQRISAQELRGGRLRLKQYGVLHEDPATDMELLTQNYTVAAVASALRDREDSLQMAAVLASEERWDELKEMLSIFHPKYVLQRRSQKRLLGTTLNSHSLELIRKALIRMPRTVTQAHSRRAGVVLALCSVDGVPSLLLEKRSPHIRAHPDEVCLPGGMVCNMNDRSIVATCLREMKEEIGGLSHLHVQVLGILRCNWGEVHHLVGVAVTPVVCYLGELPDRLVPDHREVAEVFTIPLESLLDKSLWVYKEGLAPIFLGGPHVIWGLTGYILDRFYKDILLPHSRSSSEELD